MKLSRGMDHRRGKSEVCTWTYNSVSSAHEIIQPSMCLKMDWPLRGYLYFTNETPHTVGRETKTSDMKKMNFWSLVCLSCQIFCHMHLWEESFCLNKSICDAWAYEWYQATLILRAQTEREWMGVKWLAVGRGGLERANRQKSCLSTCFPQEQRALNRWGFPDILWF